jgi:hypothetical protein
VSKYVTLHTQCLCVCLHVSAWLPMDRFPPNLTFGTYTKICQKIQISLKSGKNTEHVTRRPKYQADGIPEEVQTLYERNTMLHYTYTVYVVCLWLI